MKVVDDDGGDIADIQECDECGRLMHLPTCSRADAPKADSAQPGGAVPREPTDEMIEAGQRSLVDFLGQKAWNCALVALWKDMHDAATKADAREGKT